MQINLLLVVFIHSIYRVAASYVSIIRICTQRIMYYDM